MSAPHTVVVHPAVQALPFSLTVPGSAAVPETLLLNPKSTSAPGARVRFQDSGAAVTVRPYWVSSALQVWPSLWSPGSSQVRDQG